MAEIPSQPYTTTPWIAHTEDDLWYELGACLLGSRVPYEQALATAQLLRAAGPLSAPPDLSRLASFETKVLRLLQAPVLESSGRLRKYRFPRLRARHLRHAAKAIYEHGRSLTHLLSWSPNAQAARHHLVQTVPGVGPKQASMFLRNIGYGIDLVVLDSHVMRFMGLFLDIPHPVRSVASLPHYEKAETSFQSHAATLGVPVQSLDTAVWVVMRVLHQDRVRL